jgi:hypothetical protein
MASNTLEDYQAGARRRQREYRKRIKREQRLFQEAIRQLRVLEDSVKYAALAGDETAAMIMAEVSGPTAVNLASFFQDRAKAAIIKKPPVRNSKKPAAAPREAAAG